MNSLTLGFLYVVGISWALSETCVMAANGAWTPLIVFLVLFLLMFSVLGCAPVSDRTAEVWGGVFALGLAALLVWMAFSTITTGAMVLGIVKAVFAIAFVIAGLVSLLQSLGGSKSSSH